MILNDYQKKASLTAQYPQEKALEYLCLGLCSEAGEVAGKLKKIIRDNNSILSEDKKSQIISELGDVLWYLSQIASTLNVPMDLVAHQNITKLFDRKARDAISGDGDSR